MEICVMSVQIFESQHHANKKKVSFVTIPVPHGCAIRELDLEMFSGKNTFKNIWVRSKAIFCEFHWSIAIALI